jgi:dihydrofolate synthase / folylpolyglutamate synthase
MERLSTAADLLDRLELFGIRLGLDNMRSLLAALEHPERAFPAVLVAGTNGKGSTSTWLASIASHAGYRVGLYTSPHLEAVEERIRIDGRAVDTAELEGALVAVVEAAQRTIGGAPTYFEALTAVALVLFAQRGVELAVLEVGLGGRLDATNVVDPLLSVITSIGFDHQAHLGATLAAIAREKAGILRTGKLAIVDPVEPEAVAALAQAAAELGAELSWAESAGSFEGPEEAGVRVLRTARERYRLAPQLQGEHQRINLRLAVLAAERLAQRGFARIDRAAVERGVAGCRWPGRLEEIRLPEGAGTVLLDAAHNPAGAAALARALGERAAPYGLLFGCFADKEAGAMLPPLAARAGWVCLTRAPGPRAAAPSELGSFLERAPEIEEDLERALSRALAANAGRLLVVTGSIYLLGLVRGRLRERFGVPVPAVAPLWPLPEETP